LLEYFKPQGSDEYLESHYIMSAASIVYCITVTAAKATQNSSTRLTIDKMKPRATIREAVVQKKKIKAKIPPCPRPDAKDLLAPMLKLAISDQTASPVYYTLHSLQGIFVSSCRKPSL
jgi:hypothetical protein